MGSRRGSHSETFLVITPSKLLRADAYMSDSDLLQYNRFEWLCQGGFGIGVPVKVLHSGPKESKMKVLMGEMQLVEEGRKLLEGLRDVLYPSCLL